MAAEQKPFTI